MPGFVLAFGLIAIILIVTSLASGLDELLRGPTPPTVLDVRSRSSYDADGAQIPHSVRVLPDYVTEWAANEPIGRLVVAYCT